jgi:hypothetical protein
VAETTEHPAQAEAIAGAAEAARSMQDSRAVLRIEHNRMPRTD